MAALKVLASISLIAFAIAAQPALAANDGQGTSAGQSPATTNPNGTSAQPGHRAKLSPEQRAAKRARREARRQAKMRGQSPAPN